MKNSMSKLIGLTVIILLSLSIIVTSCKKKKADEEPAPTSTTTQEDLSAENDFALAENMMGDANMEADVVLRDTMAYKNGGVFEFCRDTDVIANTACFKQIKVKYFNCMNTFGRVRNGAIKITAYGCKYDEVGTKIRIDFENFFINQLEMTGYREITHKGIINSKRTFSVQDSTTVTDTTNGNYIHWEATRIHTWETGFLDTFSKLDVFKINSRAYYESSRGGITNLTLVTISNLIKAGCCPWPPSGSIEIIPSGKLKRTISFGDSANTNYCDTTTVGACDNKAQVTIGSNTYDITLK